jgi:hypothetical protein
MWPIELMGFEVLLSLETIWGERCSPSYHKPAGCSDVSATAGKEALKERPVQEMTAIQTSIAPLTPIEASGSTLECWVLMRTTATARLHNIRFITVYQPCLFISLEIKWLPTARQFTNPTDAAHNSHCTLYSLLQ